jgi:lysophospholipase L1-like esterase
MSLLDIPGVPEGDLTKAMVGLSNVDNTADDDKPVSDQQAAAIAGAGTALATPNTVMRRDASGRASVAAPVASTDIATKGFVETSLGLDVWPASIGAKIGFVGDSNMSGFGLANPATERWPKLFSTMAGAIENNVAVAGAGYINQGSGGASKFANQAPLLAADCTHVIINGGINDAPLTYTVAAIQAEVAATIAAVRTAAPAARITVISPFWMASAPSDGLLRVDSEIRPAIPSDVRYIEGGPWIRLDRTEWQQGDGHPNVAGAAAIAAWARDQFGGTPKGAVFGQYILAGTSDVLVSSRSTTTPTAYTIASGTVLGAKSGWWEVEGQLVLYSAANGFIWVMETARKVSIRSDVTAAPLVHRQKIKFYHPGGDLIVKVGYDPSTGAAQIITSAQSKVTARWVGIQP